MNPTINKPFVKGQTVWRPAPCGTRIEDGKVIAITPIKRRDGGTTIMYAAEFSTGRSYAEEQAWEESFFHTQSGALQALALQAREKAHTARLEADKWESVSTIALSRAIAEPTELDAADPKEAQNDGDPIRAAALPPELVGAAL